MMETLCAMLSGNSGKVLIGVAPDGRLEGKRFATAPGGRT